MSADQGEQPMEENKPSAMEDDSAANAGEVNAGEVNAGEVNAGEVNAGRMNAGETRLRPVTNLHLWEIAWVRDLAALAILTILGLTALWLRSIFQPLLMGLLFAYLFNPIVVALQERWKWSRFSVVVAVFATGVVLVLTAAVLILPVAISQATDFVGKLPDYAESLAKQSGVTDEALVEKFKEQARAFLKDPITNLNYVWNGVVTSFGVLSGVLGTAVSVGMGLCLFPIYLFFFSWHWPEVAKWPEPFIPVSRRKRVKEVIGKMDRAVGGYFRTRLIIALIMGIMYAVGWGVAGVPYWLLIGMLAGLLGIIPYAATLAWLGAMLLRFLELENGITGGGDIVSVFVWPTLVYGIVQSSDDWVLTPWLQGRELDMNFLVIMLSVLIGGAVAGLLGMLLAVPAAACVRIFWEEVIRPKLTQFADQN